jgi:glycosyltransferase involved in cell wall biosynthesis
MTGVSVIVTAHDERAFIDAAIESVLAQDRPADEIVVVDDASTDGTHAVVDARATARPDVIRVVTLSRRRGAPSARNAGAASARGELLAFLDGDDMWLPQKLAVQCSILDRHPDVGYTYGSAVELRDGHLSPTPERLGSPSGVYRPPDLCTGYLRDDYWNFWPSGLLIRRATFRLSGGFVEPLGAYQHWEDYFYACALALNDAAYVLDEPLTIYRVHDASCSHRAELSKKTIVDERVGLQWFAERLGERGPRPVPPEIVAALEERLDRNARAFPEALSERPELGTYAHLYAPAALARIRARLGALRA